MINVLKRKTLSQKQLFLPLAFLLYGGQTVALRSTLRSNQLSEKVLKELSTYCAFLRRCSSSGYRVYVPICTKMFKTAKFDLR